MNLHPDDLLLFQEIDHAMRRVAKQYELPLRSVRPTDDPSYATAALGRCCSTGDIQITMRGKTDGVWDVESRRAEDVYKTAGHELAHLRHMNHGNAFQEFELELVAAMRNTVVDHKERLLAKLVKMQAQRDGEAALGNTAAAEAFASAINRMLIENELNPTDIDYARTTDRDPVIELPVEMKKYHIERTKSRVAWQESLARIVAKANLCTFLLRTGCNQIWFVGTKSHATVAEYTFGILVPVALQMSVQEYKDYRHSLIREKRAAGTFTNCKLTETYGFREAWLASFLSRIAERFDEARAAAVRDADVRSTVPGGESQALMRLNGALVKVQRYMDDKFAKKRKYAASLSDVGNTNAAGAARGRAAADRMPIGRRGVAAAAVRGSIGGTK